MSKIIADHTGYLSAVVEEFAGETVLIVLRSSWLTDESPLMTEVRRYLAAHPHALDFEETREDADFESGTVIHTQYKISGAA